MPVTEHDRCGRFYRAITTHNLTTFVTLADEVTGAVAGLATVACAAGILHVIPVASPGTIPQRLLRVDGQGLVDTAQRGLDENRAILDEGGAGLSASAGQAVDRVEVERRGDGHDDAEEKDI